MNFFIQFFVFFFIVGCGSYNTIDHEPSIKLSSDFLAIEQNSGWYNDANGKIYEFNITVPQPNDYLCAPYDDPTGTPRPCTLEDVENDSNPYDDYIPVVHATLSLEGSIPVYGAMKQKGKSTRMADQKSFRFKIDKGERFIAKERTWQFNKHPYDRSRIRNKLAFDLIAEIPDIFSLKTKFVHLRVDNEDYGLFTHVENAGEEYLLNRGLNNGDNLYKAQNFAFFVSNILDSNGLLKPKDELEASIEQQTGKDTEKLVAMVQAVNDYTQDFNVIFERYFDRENYLTWMAINLIMANKDTVSQNFFLFNPKLSDKFYFVPWDYDGAGRPDDRYAKWELGYGVWWGIPLHKRFLSIKENRDALDAKVKLLSEKYITEENMQEKIDAYVKLIEPIVTATPDIDHLKESRWRDEVANLIPQRARDIANYESQLGHPMPYWQWATYEDGKLTLFWEKSVDFEGDKIIYDIQFSENADFNATNIIDEKGVAFDDALEVLSYEKDLVLDPGTYYMKIVAKEQNNPEHYNISFDKAVRGDDGEHRFGVTEVVVE